MKVELKKVDGTKRELKFEVPKERVLSAFSEVYTDIGKVAKVKGFRPGKVPRNVLEQHHGRLAEEEVIKKLVPEVYQEGLVQESLAPIDMPMIEDVSLKDNVLTFKATLDIKPEIKLKDYKEIKVTRKSSKVTDEEINKTLEFFKQGQGKDKEIKIDDAFAKGLGYPSLEEFKSSLSRQMEMDKDRHNRMDVENQIVEHLIKKIKFDVPHSLVHKQLHRRMDDELKRLKSQGLSEEELAKKRESLHKDLEPIAEKEVKTYLILDKIAEVEKIEVSENDNMPAKVMEFLFKEAKWEEAK